jgi:hypothetical protein
MVRLCGHDNSGHHLAPGGIGQAEHGGLADARMGEQHLLDLGGVDVLPTADDHVLQSPGDRQVAATVEGADVAGAQPTFRVDGFPCAVRHVEVAEHRLVATGADFSLLANGYDLGRERVADRELQSPPSGIGRPESRQRTAAVAPQDSATSLPPATAYPRTLAMVGFSERHRLKKSSVLRFISW